MTLHATGSGGMQCDPQWSGSCEVTGAYAAVKLNHATRQDGIPLLLLLSFLLLL